MNRLRTVAMFLIVCAVLSQAAGAAIVQYDDRATWLAAAGGVEDFVEDFSGFVVDTPFSPEPTTVAISMGTIGETGAALAFRNIVDVPPFLFGDNNGTNHASSFTNAADAGPGTETDVEIVFSTAMSAWGANFSNAGGAETVAVDAIDIDGTTVLGTITISSNNIDQFLGFVGDAGEEVGSVVIRSATQIVGGTGRGFGLDDLCAVIAAAPEGMLPVPTLGTWGLIALVLLLAAASVFFMRRRQPTGTA